MLVWRGFANWMFVLGKCWFRSSKRNCPALSSASPLRVAIGIGTSCEFSSRRRAVTVIVSTSLAGAAPSLTLLLCGGAGRPQLRHGADGSEYDETVADCRADRCVATTHADAKEPNELP